MNIFVTGAGGPAGVNVIRDLMRHGHVVIAADCDPTAVGFAFATRSELVPRSDDADFVDVLLGLLMAHEVDVIVSTIAEELMLLDDIRPQLAELGVGHWGPSRHSVEICADKLAFHDILVRHGVPTAPTATAGRKVHGPWIVKPRDGRGSRDVHSVDTPGSLRAAIRLTPNAIVQTKIDGREFSADALVDSSGGVLGMARRWRDSCRGGISTGGTTFDHDGVTRAVTDAIAATGVSGPVNVQGFVTDRNEVVIIEINPRFSGALTHSIASGCDLVAQFVQGASGGVVDPARLVSHAGVRMQRVFEDVITAAPTRLDDDITIDLTAEVVPS